jgi:hypothetical protein
MPSAMTTPTARRDTVKLGKVLTVAEQIQAFCGAGKTGELFVSNVAPPARINLVDGQVIDAQFGLKSGMEAAIALINLPDAQTEFAVDERPARRTIEVPFMEVLLEAARLKDETLGSEIDRPTQPVNPAPANPSLRVTVGGEDSLYPLRPGITTIGRSTVNDIVLNDSTISQRHASIEYSRIGVFLKDLGSTNGTYVGGTEIHEKWLGAQESLQFGAVSCAFTSGPAKSDA